MPRRTTKNSPAQPTAGQSAASQPIASQHGADPAPGQPGFGSVVDRRTGIDRREVAKLRAARARAAEIEDRHAGLPAGATTPPADPPTDEELQSVVTGLERRRGPGRRRSDFTRAAEEGELTQEQFLFVMAIDSFKRSNETMFPTWCDVLEIVRQLGYRKTMPSELKLRNAEDWRESPMNPANVRPPRWAEHGEVDAQRATGSAGKPARRAA